MIIVNAPVSRLLRPIVGLLMSVAVAACGAAPTQSSQNANVPPEYRALQDGERIIPAVSPTYLTERNRRKWVSYNGPEAPGTIVIDPYARLLYHVTEPGLAMRFGIAVGKQGRGFSGTAAVMRKEEYPYWAPTKNMIRQDPELYGPLAGGLPGGLDNPLGARALYLYRNGRDTMYRIHGTMDPSSIGKATSAGCIRLFNQDIIDLYNRVAIDTTVVVLQDEPLMHPQRQVPEWVARQIGVSQQPAAQAATPQPVQSYPPVDPGAGHARRPAVNI